LSEFDLMALLLTFKLSAISTCLLLLISVPVAWYLSRSTSRYIPVIESIIALPLVLPPSVLGFYLLIGFAPDSFIGSVWGNVTGERLAFSFEALVIGSMIYSLPFVVQPLQVAFSSIPQRLLETAATLKAKPFDQFKTIVVPLSKGGLFTALTLGFAHTMGEFGVVLMIGGNIPGETQVLSIALYDHVESLNYSQAHTVSAVLLTLSFIILLFTYSQKNTNFMFSLRTMKR